MKKCKVNKEDNPPHAGDYPLAFFLEKAKEERGERAELTLSEGRLLWLALSESFSEENIPKVITKTEFGKLKFTKKEKNIDFSISHSKDILVISVSDEGECGVDVEFCDNRRHEGAAARFLKDFTPSPHPFSECCAFEVENLLNNGGRVKKTALEPLKEREDFLPRWTALEAILKMSGDGLAAHAHSNSLLHTAKLFSGEYKTSEKEKYIITLAHRK